MACCSLFWKVVFWGPAELPKILSTVFPLPFFKWHWKVQRDTAARVWGVWAPVCHHLNVTWLRGGWSWQQLPLSTIMCELAFDPSVKRKRKTKKPHAQDKTVVAELQMLRDRKQRLSDKRFITVNTPTQTTGLDKDIHLFHLMYSLEKWLCMICFPLASY